MTEYIEMLEEKYKPLLIELAKKKEKLTMGDYIKTMLELAKDREMEGKGVKKEVEHALIVFAVRGYVTIEITRPLRYTITINEGITDE